MPELPPPDPHESTDVGPVKAPHLLGPTAVFLAGADPRSEAATPDVILDMRPGLLFVCGAG